MEKVEQLVPRHVLDHLTKPQREALVGFCENQQHLIDKARRQMEKEYHSIHQLITLLSRLNVGIRDFLEFVLDVAPSVKGASNIVKSLRQVNEYRKLAMPLFEWGALKKLSKGAKEYSVLTGGGAVAGLVQTTPKTGRYTNLPLDEGVKELHRQAVERWVQRFEQQGKNPGVESICGIAEEVFAGFIELADPVRLAKEVGYS